MASRALVLLALTASCETVENAPTLTLDVTFAGAVSCPSDVTSVQATESTGALPQTTMACSAATSAGVPIVIQDVPPGTYDIDIVGLLNSTMTWSSRDQFVVTATGTNTFTVNLNHLAGDVLFDFLIADPTPNPMNTGGMTCSQAEIMNMSITVDPGTSSAMTTSVPCFDTASMSQEGQITGVMPGMHSFDVSVSDSTGTKLWDAMIPDQMITEAGPNQLYPNLEGQVPGPVAVALAFPGGATCEEAQVAQVTYQLTNPDGSLGQSGMASCTGNDVTIGLTGTGFPAGLYSITLQGCGSDGTTCPFESTGFPTPVPGIPVIPQSLPASPTVVTMVSTSAGPDGGP